MTDEHEEQRVVVIGTVSGIRARLSGVSNVAFVPTMGALHEGHLALVKRAREVAETVVVSIFVNPLQFGEPEDLNRYPRELDADLALLPDDTIVFAPSVDELYPAGTSETRVSAGDIATRFEGASRPGHFDGMLTVVAKLLNIVTPSVAVFGQKDAQQVFLVRRMVRDLNIPVVVDVVQTVREPDGLALSSRNRFLSPTERAASLALSRALAAAAGCDTVDAALSAGREILAQERGIDLDYLELVDPATFLPVRPDYRGLATAIVAAQLGSTRLIDNRDIQLG